MRTPTLLPLPLALTLLAACLPELDEPNPDLPDGYVLDADGDGYTGAADCDDAQAGIHPGAADTTADGVDQDCSGVDGPAAPTDTDTATDTQTASDTDTATDTQTASGTDTATDTQTASGTDTATDTATDTDTGTGTSPTNAPPTAPDAWLSPAVPHTGDEIWAAAVATDPDGDVLSYRFVWSLDGVEQPDLTGSFVPGERVARGDAWSVSVVATDGEDTSGAGTAQVTVANSAPSITSVTLTPAQVYTNTVLTANVTGADRDVAVGDSLHYIYNWYVNGDAVSGAHGATLAGATAFDKWDTVSVRVIPRDDADAEGAAVTSDTVAVLDSPPTAPVVEITPTEPVPGRDNLVCALSTPSTDADGDEIFYTFTWQLDGADWPSESTGSTGHPGDTVLGTYTSSEDEWHCSSTPASSGTTGAPGMAARRIEHPWTLMWSDPLSTGVQNTIYVNSPIGTQNTSEVSGRPCLYQTADWNVAYIPVPRPTSGHTAIEVDYYMPADGYAVGIEPFAARYANAGSSMFLYWELRASREDRVVYGDWHDNAGNDFNLMRTPYEAVGVDLAGRWTTIRVEASAETLTTRHFVDGVLVRTVNDVPILNRATDYVTLRSWRDQPGGHTNTCWSNLRVYE